MQPWAGLNYFHRKCTPLPLPFFKSDKFSIGIGPEVILKLVISLFCAAFPALVVITDQVHSVNGTPAGIFLNFIHHCFKYVRTHITAEKHTLAVYISPALSPCGVAQSTAFRIICFQASHLSRVSR